MASEIKPEAVRKFVLDLADRDASGCSFWACPGPDVEPIPMASCQFCTAVYEARQLRDVLD